MKIFLHISLLMLCFIELNAQKKTYVAEMLENRANKTVYFTRDSFPESYTTKYVIHLNDNEIYELNFSISEGNDSGFFKIFYVDKRKYTCGTKIIKFETGSSYYIIKNDKPNDTDIDYNDRNLKMLFSVPDIERPFVILNKFLSIDDEETLYKLTPVDSAVLKKHRKKTDDYITNKTIEGNKKATHDKAITGLINDMKAYSNSIIDNIKKDEENKKMRPATRTPGSGLNDVFKNKVDRIFINILKPMFLFNDYDIAARFTFSCNGHNKLDSNKTEPRSMNGNPIEWFKDTFNKRIRPVLLTMEYQTIVDDEPHPTLKEDFNNQFADKINKLIADGKKFGYDGKEFDETINQVYADFEPYLNKRNVNAPTLYTYDIKYTSKVDETTWKLMADGSVKGKDKDKSGLKTPDLELLFKKRLSDLNYGPGKYDIKICTIYINNEQMGQDIQLLPKKETPNY